MNTLQLREMQDICTLACEKFAAGDKVGEGGESAQKYHLPTPPHPSQKKIEKKGGNMAFQRAWKLWKCHMSPDSTPNIY